MLSHCLKGQLFSSIAGADAFRGLTPFEAVKAPVEIGCRRINVAQGAVEIAHRMQRCQFIRFVEA